MDGSLEASEFSTGFMDRYVALVSAGIVTSPFSKAFSPEIPDTRTPLRKLCVSDTAVVSVSVEATSEVYRSAFCPPCAFVFSSESICCVSASSAETVCCVAIAASLTVVAAAGTTQVFTATAQLSKSASHRFLYLRSSSLLQRAPVHAWILHAICLLPFKPVPLPYHI